MLAFPEPDPNPRPGSGGALPAHLPKGVDDPDCGGRPADRALPALSLRRLKPAEAVAGPPLPPRGELPAAGVRSPAGDHVPRSPSAANGLRKEPELRAVDRPAGLARPLAPGTVASSDLRLSPCADIEDSRPGPVTAPVCLLCGPSDRALGGYGLSALAACRPALSWDDAAAAAQAAAVPASLPLPRPAIAITMARAAFAAWYCRAAASTLA